MTSLYETLGLKTVINASGKMTALGSSVLNDQIASSLKEASQNYVVMDELIENAGKVIAKHTGAEDGCPTNSASSGVALTVAALIAGKNLTEIEKLPFTDNPKREFILQRGHDIHFGANIRQMIHVGGGVEKLVGASNKVDSKHIEEAINENTAGLVYIKSHHAVQKGMVSLDEMIRISENYRMPLIVDAAAETDLKKYIAKGADIVIYSGSKAVNGPTSGFICGKASIVAACREQYKGIGRAMKVSKESIIGLLASLELYDKRVAISEDHKKSMKKLCAQLNTLKGLTCAVKQDEAGREIYRTQINVNSGSPYSATELRKLLENGDPAIHLRNHYANVGILFVDPRPLKVGQTEIIFDRLKEIMGEK